MISHSYMTRLLPELNIAQLNEIFTPLTFEQRIRMLSRVFPMEEVLYTSSFGTRSVMLLHLVSRFRPKQPVHFINTTFHFKETLAYRKKIAKEFGLNVIDVLPEKPQNEITAREGWWRTNPDVCCAVNKVLPLEPIKAKHKIWLTGLMAYQTGYRSALEVFEEVEGIIKFNPLIDIDEGEWYFYADYHQLPRHPLEALGYGSVGCEHCTTKGQGRSGRWKGEAKTECGLHPAGFVDQLQEGK